MIGPTIDTVKIMGPQSSNLISQVQNLIARMLVNSGLFLIDFPRVAICSFTEKLPSVHVNVAVKVIARCDRQKRPLGGVHRILRLPGTQME